MKRLLFIVYYDAIEYLLSIKESFLKYNFDVAIYPLFKYAYDQHSKIDNYQDHFDNFICEYKPDIILWWFIDVPVSVFDYITTKNKDIYYIIYNPDDPHNLHDSLFMKCKFFDLILTPCNESKYLYNLFSNNSNIVFSPFGFDSKFIYPIAKELHNGSIYEKYMCDICLHTYNLYVDKNQYPDQSIYLLDLINDLIEYCKTNKKILKLYGTSIIKEFFPDYYAGDLSYTQINLAYNFSKILVSTHSSAKSSLPINNQLMSMLASGSIVFVDNIRDINQIIKNGTNCIVMDPKKYLQQIDTVLNDYSSYESIKIAAAENANAYSWDEWVKKIIYNYSIAKFDGDFYSKLYNYDTNINLLNYWIDNGFKNNEICYKFDVPESFNHERYVSDNKIDDKCLEFSFLHWKQNSKNLKYIVNITKKNINKTFDVDKIGITIDQYYEICCILGKIKNNHNRDQNLLKLAKISMNNYNLQINEIIEAYFSSIA